MSRPLSLRLYLDECVDYRLIAPLIETGCDVVSVSDAGTRQQSDEAQLLRATAEGRLLVSHNQRHFRRLHARFIDEQ